MTNTGCAQPQPERYHLAESGGIIAGVPIALETYTALQHMVNQVAGDALVVRRVLDVDYVTDMVPVGLLEFPEKSQEGLGYTPCGPAVGTLLQAQVVLDAVALHAVAQSPRLAGLPDLVVQTRKLALNETHLVLQQIAADTRVKRAALCADKPIGPQLLSGVTDLRAQGFSGQLLLVIHGDAWLELDRKDREDLQAETGGNIAVMPSDTQHVAILMAPGAQNVRLVIGDNYALRWLRTDGVHHIFALTVGVLAVVTDPTAVEVWTNSQLHDKPAV